MRALLPVLILLLISAYVADANAGPNANGKWVLHYAGPHNSKTNTCATGPEYCDYVTSAVVDAGRYDVYVIAADVQRVASTRYGLVCEVAMGGGFFFYGWTTCSDFEDPSAAWPGCGEGNAQTWTDEQLGLAVTVGILEVYFYGGIANLELAPDPRVGFGEFCDGSSPSPQCDQNTLPGYFGAVGFNKLGFLPVECGVPTDQTSWGALKALYK